jgi:hypothetical protein
MCALWLQFGLFVKKQKHLLGEIEEFDKQCGALFSFESSDLLVKLQNVRNLGMDQVILDHARDKNKRGRDNDSPDRRPGKRPVPGVQGEPKPKGTKPPKGFCMNYYAFLAKAPHHSGGLYSDCSNNPKCARFCHVAVSSQNKVAIRDCVMDRYADRRVKAEVEKYLASF